MFESQHSKRSKDHNALNAFPRTSDHISNLDQRFSSFMNNVRKEVDDIRSLSKSGKFTSFYFHSVHFSSDAGSCLPISSLLPTTFHKSD